MYGGMVFLIGAIHLWAVLWPAGLGKLLYIVLPAAAFAAVWLNTRWYLPSRSPGLGWNNVFWLCQAVLAGVSLLAGSELFGMPFLVFAGLEAIRLSIAKRMDRQKRELRQMDEECAAMNEAFKRVRAERHDFLKHIAALHYMLEKGESAGAKAYLDDLVEGYEETNLSIKGELGAVAGILHQMHQRGKQAGIEVVYDFDLPLSSLPLQDKEIVALTGNLLVNSLEAAETWQKENGEQAAVTVQFYKKSALFILICGNPAVPIPAQTLDKLYQIPGITTKGEGHEGLGTKIIQDVVKANGGYLDFVHKDETFTVKIKLPAVVGRG